MSKNVVEFVGKKDAVGFAKQIKERLLKRVIKSLNEKQKIIKNFDQCLDWYNTWTAKNNFGKEYTTDEMYTKAMDEEKQLTAPLNRQLEHQCATAVGQYK